MLIQYLQTLPQWSNCSHLFLRLFISCLIKNNNLDSQVNGLSLGDQIWEINNRDVRSEPLTGVERMLVQASSKDVVLLVISTLRTVEIRADNMVLETIIHSSLRIDTAEFNS
jgi:hypothetical protein